MIQKIQSKSWPRIIGFGFLGAFLGGVVGAGLIIVPSLFTSLDQGALLIFVTMPAGIIVGAFVGIMRGLRTAKATIDIAGTLLGAIIGLVLGLWLMLAGTESSSYDLSSYDILLAVLVIYPTFAGGALGRILFQAIQNRRHGAPLFSRASLILLNLLAAIGIGLFGTIKVIEFRQVRARGIVVVKEVRLGEEFQLATREVAHIQDLNIKLVLGYISHKLICPEDWKPGQMCFEGSELEASYDFFVNGEKKYVDNTPYTLIIKNLNAQKQTGIFTIKVK